MAGLRLRAATAVSLLLVTLLTTAPARANDDPFESVNRAIFSFNNSADKYVIRPVAKGYAEVMPSPARVGVNNFFSNFSDFTAGLNAALQGRLRFAADNGLRVVVNSTLGFFGLIDVASDMGIPRYRTDFGHTLAIWGVPRGPYVMFPLLGPRTFRSGVGSVVDGYVDPSVQVFTGDERWGLIALNIVDQRAAFLGTDRLLSGDQYIFFRDAYLQQRAALVSDGQAKDVFSEFDDSWEQDDL